MSGLGIEETFEFNFTINNVIYSLSLKVHIIKMEGQVGMEMMFIFKIVKKGVRMNWRDKGVNNLSFFWKVKRNFENKTG